MTRLRCRFVRPSSHIWSRQCEHPAKGERVIDAETQATLPACGVHLRARYAYEYRQSSSTREFPVKETM